MNPTTTPPTTPPATGARPAKPAPSKPGLAEMVRKQPQQAAGVAAVILAVVLGLRAASKGSKGSAPAAYQPAVYNGGAGDLSGIMSDGLDRLALTNATAFEQLLNALNSGTGTSGGTATDTTSTPTTSTTNTTAPTTSTNTGIISTLMSIVAPATTRDPGPYQGVTADMPYGPTGYFGNAGSYDNPADNAAARAGYSDAVIRSGGTQPVEMGSSGVMTNAFLNNIWQNATVGAKQSPEWLSTWNALNIEAGFPGATVPTQPDPLLDYFVP